MLQHLADLWVSVLNFIGLVYMLLHVLLPRQFIHPLRVTISCTEPGCKWEGKSWDRGGPFTMRVLKRLKARHKRHFIIEHPDVEWVYG